MKHSLARIRMSALITFVLVLNHYLILQDDGFYYMVRYKIGHDVALFMASPAYLLAGLLIGAAGLLQPRENKNRIYNLVAVAAGLIVFFACTLRIVSAA